MFNCSELEKVEVRGELDEMRILRTELRQQEHKMRLGRKEKRKERVRRRADARGTELSTNSHDSSIYYSSKLSPSVSISLSFSPLTLSEVHKGAILFLPLVSDKHTKKEGRKAIVSKQRCREFLHSEAKNTWMESGRRDSS